MALFNCNFFSNSLGMNCSMNIIMPQQSCGIGMDSKKAKEKIPVLYLLHGLSDDHTIWGRRTSIERYAAAYGIAVVMPNAHRSFYTDMDKGGNYFTFISRELPELIENWFPVSRERQDTFIAGLSMGGYGALKTAFSRPDKFAAAAGLSGCLDIATAVNRNDLDMLEEFKRIFGDLKQLSGSNNDLMYLSGKVAKLPEEKRPLVYITCGTEDFLYQDNIAFKNHMDTISYQYQWHEESGEHNWQYWDRNIQRILEWLPISNK